MGVVWTSAIHWSKPPICQPHHFSHRTCRCGTTWHQSLGRHVVIILGAGVNRNQGSWSRCSHTVRRKNKVSGWMIRSLTPMEGPASCAANEIPAVSKTVAWLISLPSANPNSLRRIWCHYPEPTPTRNYTACWRSRIYPSWQCALPATPCRRLSGQGNHSTKTMHQQSPLVPLSTTACTPDWNLTKRYWTYYWGSVHTGWH